MNGIKTLPTATASPPSADTLASNGAPEAKHPAGLKSRLAAGIVEQSGDLVFVTNTAGVIEYVNPTFERVTGFSSAEAVGAEPRLLRSGHHDQEFYGKIWRDLLAGRVFRDTLVNRRKSGEEFLLEQTISPIRNKDGRITQFVAVGRDVTETRRAQERDQRMQLARALQQRFYPQCAPRFDGFQIAGAAWPADSTGGDYFDYLPLPGDALGVIVGDVSGHGYDSALLMSETRAYMRSLALADDDPGRILTRANRALALDVPDNRFVAALLVRLEPHRRSLSFANAGHETGYLVDALGNVKLSLRGLGLPLGIFPGTTYETPPAVELTSGDTIVLVTDGVVEPVNGAGEAFGRDRLLRLIADARALSAGDLVQHIRDTVVGFAGRRRLADDLTVVVCRVS